MNASLIFLFENILTYCEFGDIIQSNKGNDEDGRVNLVSESRCLVQIGTRFSHIAYHFRA